MCMDEHLESRIYLVVVAGKLLKNVIIIHYPECCLSKNKQHEPGLSKLKKDLLNNNTQTNVNHSHESIHIAFK